jgi:8-oxo-dGTP pyrophosphatase MutT (NUDIX family)
MSSNTQFDVSAGGVIYRTENNEVMVCLIKTPPNGDWQLPKGLVDDNESFEQTALREVKEETGLEGTLEGRIDSIDYWFWQEEGDEKIRHHKTVYFFLLKYITGVTEDHDDEVQEAVWMPLTKALSTLSFDGERAILRKAEEMLRPGNQGGNGNRELT